MNRLFILREQAQFDAVCNFLNANWSACSKEKKPLSVAVSVWQAKRSKSQNKRYWAIVGDIAEQSYVAGKKHTGDQWHEYFKRRFIGFEELPEGGVIGISSASLDVESFAEYILKIEVYAVDTLGCEFTA